MHFCWLVADSKLCTGCSFIINFSFILVSNKWSHFMICCILCTLEAVVKFSGNRRSCEAFNVTKTWESLEWEVWEFCNEGLIWVWSNQRNESEEREWEKRNERNESLLKFRVPWQFGIPLWGRGIWGASLNG